MLHYAKFGWVCVKLNVFFCPTLIITCLHRKLSYHTFNELNSLILTEFPLPVIHSLHFYTLWLCKLMLYFFLPGRSPWSNTVLILLLSL